MLYAEDFLLALSLIGCAVLFFFMIKKLFDMIEYNKRNGKHSRPYTGNTIRDIDREERSVPQPGREGAVYAAGRGRRDKRSGLHFGLTK